MFLYFILGSIVILAIWVTLGSRKKTWYKVYLANNDVMLLCRDMNNRWWRSNGTYLRFTTEQGVEITFPANAHWILMMEEVPIDQLDVARADIRRIKENAARVNN